MCLTIAFLKRLFGNTKISSRASHCSAEIDINIQSTNMQFFYCKDEAQVKPVKK